ncbi:hypothetical protein UYSO10_3936 [Kosakonia radicincitans]|uniref:hypothetical protein n=1 Tax=Kosakonia radicincitans TaxID=283686 RepID=UPI001181DD9D|nr:hypothetical protein [Kosakonia radicincitans]VVT52232.1 hypothetical protein UYSO10_3936 [Kosakonia radicincitans]
MSIKDLKSFITQQKQKQQEEEEAFIPEEQIKEYQLLVERFYKLVTDSISELIEDELIIVDRERIKISEEALGEYEIDSLLLLINSKKIKFVPAGTMLIGSKGRIDVFGPFGSEKYLLIRKGVSKPRDLVQIRVRDASGKHEEPSKLHAKLTIEDWEWKTLPSDSRWMNFNDVTSETIADLIMRMING